MTNKGYENLKPMNTRSKEEARELGKKGGIASGKARAERKSFKEELLTLLKNGDTQKNVSVALISKALDGDIKAFEVLRDTIGEKPSDKLDLNTDKPFEISIKVIK